MKPSLWTPERIDLLTKLWAERVSASEIARKLGCGLSRCAILRKVHRLQLPTHAAQAHRKFISAECTQAAAAAGVTVPTDPRAWGAPFRRAARDGIIRRIGYGPSLRRHLAPTPLWESALCGADGAAARPPTKHLAN